MSETLPYDGPTEPDDSYYLDRPCQWCGWEESAPGIDYCSDEHQELHEQLVQINKHQVRIDDLERQLAERDARIGRLREAISETLGALDKSPALGPIARVLVWGITQPGDLERTDQ